MELFICGYISLGLTFTDESAAFINLEKAGYKIFTMPLTSSHLDIVFESLEIPVEVVQLVDGLKGPLVDTISASSICNLAFSSGDVKGGSEWHIWYIMYLHISVF